MRHECWDYNYGLGLLGDSPMVVVVCRSMSGRYDYEKSGVGNEMRGGTSNSIIACKKFVLEAGYR